MKWPDDFINKIICGDCLEVMKQMPDWRLRDYGVDGQYGLEQTPEEYIETMTTVFSEVKRILKKEGTLWLNIGDSYGSSNIHKDVGWRLVPIPSEEKYKKNTSLPHKCLCMIPERLAWSLIQTGWTLRNKIIWYKPNGMPSSIKDRFSNKWEYLFLFSKSRKYYFDLEAVLEPYTEPMDRWGGDCLNAKGKSVWDEDTGQGTYRNRNFRPNPLGKNPGDVFIIPTHPFPEAHFAVFPEKLCEKPIKAGCPEGGIVVDLFCGAGTTAYIAKETRRKYIGIEINPDYCKIAERRLAQDVL